MDECIVYISCSAIQTNDIFDLFLWVFFCSMLCHIYIRVYLGLFGFSVEFHINIVLASRIPETIRFAWIGNWFLYYVYCSIYEHEYVYNTLSQCVYVYMVIIYFPLCFCLALWFILIEWMTGSVCKTFSFRPLCTTTPPPSSSPRSFFFNCMRIFFSLSFHLHRM